jgi:hypothetical protein
MELREELFLLRGYVWLSCTTIDMVEVFIKAEDKTE